MPASRFRVLPLIVACVLSIPITAKTTNSNRDIPQLFIGKGKNVVLPCEKPASDPLPPHVIKWDRGEVVVYMKIGENPPDIARDYESRVSIIEGKRNASLEIKNVTLKDDGIYRCQIIFYDNKVFNRTSVYLQLNVTDPPSFLETPEDVKILTQGDSLHLKCHATGRPLPSITWWKDDLRVKTEENGIFHTTGAISELALRNLTTAHRGVYHCQAQSVVGQIKHYTEVKIKAPPEFVEKPLKQIVQEGDKASFGCRAIGYPTPSRPRWLYNNVDVEASESLSGRNRVMTDGTLIIYSVSANDRGNVTCVIENGIEPSPRANASLLVQFRARVHDMPPFINAGNGLTAILRCPSEAEPPVNRVDWRKDDVLLKPNLDKRMSVDQDGSLVIRPARYLDSGEYTCTPYNILGTAGVSTGTNLKIRKPPSFRSKPNKVYEAEIGKALEIPCTGQGDPPPNIYWRKIHDDNAVSYQVRDGSLFISSVVANMHGTWQCVLSNSVAEVPTNVELHVKYTVPRTPENISAQPFSDSALRISWTPGYNGGYPQHFIVWYRQAGKVKPAWDTHEVEATHNATILDNLLPDTTYEISVLPVNKIMNGPFSKTVTARTKTSRRIAVPLESAVPTPQALYASTTSDGLVQLSWRKPQWHLLHRSRLPTKRTQEMYGNILGFLVEYRWTGINKSGSSRRKRSVQSLHKPMPQKSHWTILTNTYENITSVIFQPYQLYRDTDYEFRVLTASPEEYSNPSNPVAYSTNGLSAYPPYHSFVMASSSSPVVIGVLVAVILLLLIIGIALYCVCWKKKVKRKNSPYVTTRIANENHIGSSSPLNGKVIQNSHSLIVDLTEKGGGGVESMEKLEIDPTEELNDDAETPFLRQSKIEEASRVFNAFIERNSNKADNESRKETLSSDRSSVRLRRETSVKVLDFYKRRSLTDQTYYKIRKDSKLRGGTRSASTSPERHHLRPEDNMNSSLDSKGRPRIRLYSRPIDEEGSAQQRRMIVMKRKSQKSSNSDLPQKNLSGAPPSDSSESPVFGVVGTLKRPPISAQSSPERSSPTKSRPIQRQSRRRSPFNESLRHGRGGSNDNIIKTPFAPFEPVHSSSPRDYYSSPEVSPNRVKERRTVAYNPNEDDAIPRQQTQSSPTRRDSDWKKSNSLTYEQSVLFTPRRNRSEYHNRTYGPHNEGNNTFFDHRPLESYEVSPAVSYYSKSPYQMARRAQPRTRYSLAPRTTPVLQNSSSRQHYHPSPPVGGIAAVNARSRASYSFGNRQPYAIYSPSPVYEPHHHHQMNASQINHPNHPSTSDPLTPQSTCEIDCSNSDIEVRFFKDADGNEYSSILPRDHSGSGEMVTSHVYSLITSTHHGIPASSKLTPSDGVPVNSSRNRVVSPSVLKQSQRRHSVSPSQRAATPNAGQPRRVRQAKPTFVNVSSKPSVPAPTSLPITVIGSSDYGSQDTSNSSTSPMPFNTNHTSTFSPSHPRLQPHERPPRKDTSSVEENYEWDSEIAMESEVVEALRQFGALKKSGPLSDELLDELNKITKVTRGQTQNRQRAHSADILESHSTLEEETDRDCENTGPNYSKESMALRCAALRAEFLHYQQLQELDEDGVT